MNRIRSIDVFRGICIINLMMVHYFIAWLSRDQSWIITSYWAYFDFMGACAFIFISGISIMLFYKKKMQNIESSNYYNKISFRNEYLIRGFIIFTMSMVVNISQAIFFSNASWLWVWDVLHTLSIAIILAWPFLKFSKRTRIAASLIIMVCNYLIFEFLVRYKGQLSINGAAYYILYNSMMGAENPILPSFSLFLIGTVIGEIIFEISHIKNETERKRSVKRNFLYPSLLAGALLITFGVLFEFPAFIHNRTFSWWIYVMGIDLVLIAIFYSVEKLITFKSTLRYKFLSYFSYYSLTIFIFHQLLGYLFLHLLNVYTYYIIFITTIFLLGVLLREVYKKWGGKPSIKRIIGEISVFFAHKIDDIFRQPRFHFSHIAHLGFKNKKL
jgi:uncharacterized membrane protein